MPYFSRGELEGKKKIADYKNRVESVMTEEHGIIELAPYEYKGKKYQIFLTRRDLFKSPVDTYGYLVADSRAALKNKIADCVEASRPHLFFPIMQIDASPPYKFGLSRYWITKAQDGNMYMCDWDTPKELREDKMRPLHPTFPVGQGACRPLSFPVGLCSINKLPFIDTAQGALAYYALYRESVWQTFRRLNNSLDYLLIADDRDVRGNVLANFTMIEGRYAASQLHGKLCEIMQP